MISIHAGYGGFTAAKEFGNSVREPKLQYLAIKKVSGCFCAKTGINKFRASGDFLNGQVLRALG